MKAIGIVLLSWSVTIPLVLLFILKLDASSVPIPWLPSALRSYLSGKKKGGSFTTRILSHDPFIAHLSQFISGAEREYLIQVGYVERGTSRLHPRVD